jgi:hypothetical protein
VGLIMHKKLLTSNALQEWLTEQIQKIEGCQNCKFGGIIKLADLDENGCNWSDTITISTGGTPREIYEPAALYVIKNAKAQFNLID